jgi:hypothetical protein
MFRWILNRYRVHMALTTEARRRRPARFDARLGFALLRDRRVPSAHKGSALLYGAAGVAGVIGVETVLVALIAAALHVPGLGINPIVALAQVLAGLPLLAAMFLARLAPREIVTRVRIERYAVIPLRLRNGAR